MENEKTKSSLPPLPTSQGVEPSDEDQILDEMDTAPDLVRVTNTQPRLLHLPDSVKTSSGPEGPRITGVGSGKSLQPGGNNVERALWDRAKRHKEVRSWLRLGWLKEGGDVSQPEGPQAPPNLVSYAPNVAMAMAEGEDDHAILMRWLKVERRPEVQAAIKKQIESVGSPKRRQRS